MKRNALLSLKKMNLPSNFSAMARALLRPLSRDLVEVAFENLHNNVSPGDDGTGAKFYKVYAEVFIPRMLGITQECFESGSILPDLAVGLINSIPKTTGVATVNKLRPIVLQDVKKNG